MQVDQEFVRKVARVARLQLSEEETVRYVSEFQEVLDTFAILDRAPTQGVKPSIHPMPITNVVREDIPGNCLSLPAVLSLTPHRKDNYFRGPRVIE